MVLKAGEKMLTTPLCSFDRRGCRGGCGKGKWVSGAKVESWLKTLMRVWKVLGF